MEQSNSFLFNGNFRRVFILMVEGLLVKREDLTKAYARWNRPREQTTQSTEDASFCDNGSSNRVVDAAFGLLEEIHSCRVALQSRLEACVSAQRSLDLSDQDGLSQHRALAARAAPQHRDAQGVDHRHSRDGGVASERAGGAEAALGRTVGAADERGAVHRRAGEPLNNIVIIIFVSTGDRVARLWQTRFRRARPWDRWCWRWCRRRGLWDGRHRLTCRCEQ